MTAMLIEDEAFARAQLTKILSSNFPEISICAYADSVESSVDYLKNNAHPDIIFMDVELSDGNSFEIFRQVSVQSSVIMTTAYDSYAIKAFEAGSVDYLLKPIELSALSRAVARCRDEKNSKSADFSKLLDTLTRKEKRIIVKSGDRLIPIELSNVAYFCSEDKYNYLISRNGEKYIIDNTMDYIAQEYEGEDFFRVSRGCVVSRKAVKSVRHIDAKYIICLEPKPAVEISVSRSRTEAFIAWLQ